MNSRADAVRTAPRFAAPDTHRKRSETRWRKIAWWSSAGVLAIGGIIMLAPFIFMVSTSFNADARTTIPFPPQIIPRHPTLEAYRIAVEAIDLGRLYLNTFLLEFGELAFSLTSALLSGYALSKIRPKGHRVIMVVALMTMMIPSESTILPNFMTFSMLGLLDTYWPIWIPSIAYPFGTFLVKQYLDALPGELRDAARVDGAGELRTLITVYLPLCKGILATLFILQFLSVWNNYLWPLIVINSPEKFTIQLGIASFNIEVGGMRAALPATNMAATILSMIPILAVYIFFQRYIVENISAGALKG